MCCQKAKMGYTESKEKKGESIWKECILAEQYWVWKKREKG